MEMHQVRYFLAVARTLHFTRAAEECNVAQPSLTRAIKQLEAELGGDLFRRERPQAQLTELGERMVPHLKQCYESALSAHSLATSLKKGEAGSLKLALSRTIDLTLLVPHLRELKRLFNRVEFKLLRGTSAEVLELLKKGDAELALGEIGDAWDRLDSWPLFTEAFQLALNGRHPLAASPVINIADLAAEQLLRRSYCEHADQVEELLRGCGCDIDRSHEVTSERDLITLLEADFGIAVVPRTAACPQTLVRTPVNGLELRRTVHLYAVAGRQRSAAAAAVMKLLRCADWSRHVN